MVVARSLSPGPRAAAREKLALDPALRLRPALARAMTEVLAYAARQAQTAARQPSVAVHELRKAIRRARALLAVSRPLVGRATVARLSATLRAVQARTSSLRDVDILRAAAARFATAGKLSSAQRRTLAAFAAEVGAARRRAREDRAVVEAVSGRAAQLEAVALGFAAALPALVEDEALVVGVRLSYRRARRALGRAHKHRHDGERFHSWRKRTKALAYGLELAASRCGRRADRQRKRFAEIAAAQGEVTDLMVLRESLRAWGVARRDHGAPLIDVLDRCIDRRRRAVERKGRQAFARAPHAFAARVC
jgi:CHAD domain-containing protein